VKKILFIAIAAVLVMFAGCASTNYDLTTNSVGWSSYADISVKDFATCGIISMESQVVCAYGPFGIKKEFRGSRIVYSDLIEEAKKLGADDIINVRIEITNYNVRQKSLDFNKNVQDKNYSPSFIEYFTGYSTTWKYKATALAIKYTNPVERIKSDRVHTLNNQDKK